MSGVWKIFILIFRGFLVLRKIVLNHVIGNVGSAFVKGAQEFRKGLRLNSEDLISLSFLLAEDGGRFGRCVTLSIGDWFPRKLLWTILLVMLDQLSS